jgi:hypothetical protein
MFLPVIEHATNIMTYESAAGFIVLGGTVTYARTFFTTFPLTPVSR